MAGMVSEVADASFQVEVLDADVPVLVDFWAPWCGPCLSLGPIVEKIAAERGDALRVVKLNVDDHPQTASRFNVLSLPTLILFRRGLPVKTVVGAFPKSRLDQELEPLLS